MIARCMTNLIYSYTVCMAVMGGGEGGAHDEPDIQLHDKCGLISGTGVWGLYQTPSPTKITFMTPYIDYFIPIVWP